MRHVIAILILFCAELCFAQTASAYMNASIKAAEGLKEKKGVLTIVEASIDVFFKTHDIIFFFASTCPHCHVAAPILKAWANAHGAEVLAKTFDDKGLEGFEDARPPDTKLTAAAFEGRAISYPAIFIINIDSKTLYPVTFGALSNDAFDKRMQDLIVKITAYERGGA